MRSFESEKVSISIGLPTSCPATGGVKITVAVADVEDLEDAAGSIPNSHLEGEVHDQAGRQVPVSSR